MTIVLGIDPGAVSAAWGLLSSDLKLARTGDVPVVDRQVDAHNFDLLLQDMRSELFEPEEWLTPAAVIEKVSAMPKQGVASSFRFGKGCGLIEGMVIAREFSLFHVTPTEWKKHFKLGADKEKARKMAIDRFPALAPDLKRVKDAGRAEALLIALWWIECIR